MGWNLVGTRNEAQSSGRAVSVLVIFSSTWRQLNLNFLDIGFSLRCKGSKMIDKPSLNNVSGLLCSGGGAFKSADVWKCISEKLSEQQNLNWNVLGQKTPESGTEQKLWRICNLGIHLLPVVQFCGRSQLVANQIQLEMTRAFIQAPAAHPSLILSNCFHKCHSIGCSSSNASWVFIEGHRSTEYKSYACYQLRASISLHISQALSAFAVIFGSIRCKTL
jgi:hypothetical protein